MRINNLENENGSIYGELEINDKVYNFHYLSDESELHVYDGDLFEENEISLDNEFEVESLIMDLI